MLVSSSSLGEKRDENRQKRERATTTTILHVRKRELNAALWTKKRSLTPPSSCILILSSSSSVKRKFSFNELLYDVRDTKKINCDLVAHQSRRNFGQRLKRMGSGRGRNYSAIEKH